MLPTAIVFYGLLLAGGVFWLWLRDRLPIIHSHAVGSHGLWVGVAAGAGLGCAVSGVLLLAARYSRVYARLEAWLSELIGPLSDAEVMGLALLSGVIEEFFFRLAMQDALGIYWTSALFALLHGGRWLWAVMSGILGLVFGWMMIAGFGLVSVAVAHAVINYLGLRRARTP